MIKMTDNAVTFEYWNKDEWKNFVENEIKPLKI